MAEHDGGQVGMIKLSAFNARTKAEIADAVRDLESEGAKRLVLDLRNNLGGLFLEGVEVARLFLDGELARRTYCQACGQILHADPHPCPEPAAPSTSLLLSSADVAWSIWAAPAVMSGQCLCMFACRHRAAACNLLVQSGLYELALEIQLQPTLLQAAPRWQC